jgi:hypothetical protein
VRRTAAKKNASALAAGALFGLGLSVSQMVNPEKVLDFLDVTGRWDPSLLLVLGGAVGVTMVAFRFVLTRRQPNSICRKKQRSTAGCWPAPRCSASAGESVAIAPARGLPRFPARAPKR